MPQKGRFRVEFSKTNQIFIISDFLPNFELLRGSADFGRFKSADFRFAHNSTIFGQNDSVGCFSHSIFVNEPNSSIRINGFQEFWNFLESLESLYESLNSGHFGQMGHHHFHSILSPGFDSEVRIERFLRFWNFLIPDSRDSQKIPKFQNLWNFSILTP